MSIACMGACDTGMYSSRLVTGAVAIAIVLMQQAVVLSNAIHKPAPSRGYVRPRKPMLP
jgi:hypothetical protein